MLLRIGAAGNLPPETEEFGVSARTERIANLKRLTIEEKLRLVKKSVYSAVRFRYVYLER